MDKGFFSNKTQDWAIAKAKVLLKDQPAILVLLICLAIKGIFLYADDSVAETKLPQELTDKSQAFFDALVDNKIEDALALGIELIVIVAGMLKPKPVVPELPPKK